MSVFEKIKGVKPTVWLVVLFVILMTIGLAAEARADEQPHAAQIGLSGGVESTGGMITQRISYIYAKRWFVAYERVGGDYNDVNVFTAGRRMQLRRGHDWQPFMALGASYSDELMMQDDGDRVEVSERLTFLLAVGMSYRLGERSDLELGLDHNSTAGRSEKNRGIDRVFLQYTLRF